MKLDLRLETELMRLSETHTPKAIGKYRDGEKFCFIGALAGPYKVSSVERLNLAFRFTSEVMLLNDWYPLTIAEIAEMVLAQPEKYLR